MLRMTPNIHISSKTLFFPFSWPVNVLSPYISVIYFLFPSQAKKAKKTKNKNKNPDARQMAKPLFGNSNRKLRSTF